MGYDQTTCENARVETRKVLFLLQLEHQSVMRQVQVQAQAAAAHPSFPAATAERPPVLHAACCCMLCPSFVAARITADQPTPIPAAPVLSVIAPFEPTRFSRILHSDSRQLGFVYVAGRTYRLMRVVVRPSP